MSLIPTSAFQSATPLPSPATTTEAYDFPNVVLYYFLWFCFFAFLIALLGAAVWVLGLTVCIGIPIWLEERNGAAAAAARGRSEPSPHGARQSDGDQERRAASTEGESDRLLDPPGMSSDAEEGDRDDMTMVGLGDDEAGKP
ncbi:hypothetical protein FA95DRAFT_1563138 [Auriscalpium vulgare]|uniref:Uncharacterized protein n=1 Tax=Auriscalpium vulgare TaxID=40419 RepID=A0ACB8RHL5_9AGAM|nr:hypothetical protein FA95DRAFT_1563138 [Auriscalpium vulgare]